MNLQDDDMVSFVTDIRTAQRLYRGQYVWEMAGLDRPTGRVVVTTTRARAALSAARQPEVKP